MNMDTIWRTHVFCNVETCWGSSHLHFTFGSIKGSFLNRRATIGFSEHCSVELLVVVSSSNNRSENVCWFIFLD